jgi:hypothetical protein
VANSVRSQRHCGEFRPQPPAAVQFELSTISRQEPSRYAYQPFGGSPKYAIAASAVPVPYS